MRDDVSARDFGGFEFGASGEDKSSAGDFVVAHINESGELVGKDGLTDEERARKLYERRQAERARSKPKKKKKKK